MEDKEQFLLQFEPYLISQLNELKGKSDAYKVSAAYDTAVTIYEKFLIFINRYKQSIKQGDNDMAKETKIEFGDLIDINDIPRKQAGDSIKKMIKEHALKIPKGKAQIVRLAKWGTVNNSVSILKREGELSEAYRVVKRGDQALLIHE